MKPPSSTPYEYIWSLLAENKRNYLDQMIKPKANLVNQSPKKKIKIKGCLQDDEACTFTQFTLCSWLQISKKKGEPIFGEVIDHLFQLHFFVSSRKSPTLQAKIIVFS
ncbi:hypothetical protein Pfo_008163 [Paulownia fortunei]|nr:hypothetical protein Pfo_008163 [Paulownia fortunei]